MTWFEVLQKACKERGQANVSKEIGYSKTTVSQVLNDKYPGDVVAVQRKVEERLMHFEVECPHLGEIALSVCVGHQQRKFSATNPMRVQMYRACRQNCPHSKLCKE